MEWSEIEDIIIDSKVRLHSVYILFGYNKESGFSDIIEHHEALGENGAVKDVAKVWENVTTLCNYMFDDGAIDVNSDLLEIRQMANELYHEAMKHEATKQLFFPCHKVVQNIDKYFKRKGILVQPQQKPIAAPQQANDGNDGELTGNGNENAPEGENEPPIENYIELTPELQTTDKKAEKVFTAAYNEGWIAKRNDGGYQWKGFGDKSRTRKLAYMCAQIYETPSWKNIESFFSESQLGRDWGNVKNQTKDDGTGRQPWMNRIDYLINKALQ